MDGQYTVPADYENAFRKADLTFLHQRVFCPIGNKMIMCTDPGATTLSDEEHIYIGP